MAILENQQHELFAQRIAAGAAATNAYIAAGYAARCAKACSSRLLKSKLVRERVRELQAEIAEALKAFTISDSKCRIAAKHKRWMACLQVISERSVDPDNTRVAGGSTGLLCRTKKILGSGQWAKEVEEWEVDTGLLNAILELEEEAALELGQRKQVLEVSGNVGIIERLNAARKRVAA